MIRIAFVRACIARWFFLMPLLLAAGCATKDLSGEFKTRTPPAFSESGEEIVPSRWWTSFEDPGLDHYVEQALDGNFTLAAAYQRLAAARALARREGSDLLPDLDGVIDIAHFAGPGRNRTVYTWGLDAAYQVDVWGEIESRVDAEWLRASATRSDYHAVALTLSAEIARTWFALIEARAQAELINEQIETNRNGLRVQEFRFGLAGEAQSPDVLRQRQLVESTLEQAVVVKARVEVLEHQLAALLGKMPQEASYHTGSVLPDLPSLPDTGLPSELLQRRPDVRRDYLAFRAADRDLASAISAQYPRINLTGSLLNVADHPEDLFRDWFLGIGGQLIAPLFDGGQRRAEVQRRAALVRQSFNEYGETMLNAFREVEDALALERNQLQRIKHLEAQVELAQQSSKQLRVNYLYGVGSFLDVFSADQTQQRLQRELLSARLELLLIRVSLYSSLAGGFDTCPQGVPLDAALAPLDSAQTPLDDEDLVSAEEFAEPLDLPPKADGESGAETDPDAEQNPVPTTESDLEQLLRSVASPPELDVNE